MWKVLDGVTSTVELSEITASAASPALPKVSGVDPLHQARDQMSLEALQRGCLERSKLLAKLSKQLGMPYLAFEARKTSSFAMLLEVMGPGVIPSPLKCELSIESIKATLCQKTRGDFSTKAKWRALTEGFILVCACV